MFELSALNRSRNESRLRVVSSFRPKARRLGFEPLWERVAAICRWRDPLCGCVPARRWRGAAGVTGAPPLEPREPWDRGCRGGSSRPSTAVGGSGGQSGVAARTGLLYPCCHGAVETEKAPPEGSHVVVVALDDLWTAHFPTLLFFVFPRSFSALRRQLSRRFHRPPLEERVYVARQLPEPGRGRGMSEWKVAVRRPPARSRRIIQARKTCTAARARAGGTQPRYCRPLWGGEAARRRGYLTRQSREPAHELCHVVKVIGRCGR